MLKNLSWNIAGVIAPAVVGLYAVPKLLVLVGAERMGVISIGWMLVGYFGVLDLGLGRALTRSISESNDHPLQSERQIYLEKLATKIMLSVGAGWMILLYLVAPWLSETIFTMPASLQKEAASGIRWLACAVPAMMYASSRIAVMEGLQRFKTLNFIKIPVGSAMFLAPLVVATFSLNAEFLLASLFAVRLTTAFVFLNINIWPKKLKINPGNFDYKIEIKSLLHFGGWLTVSNIISPILAYFDRFFIGAALTMSAVAYYTIPHDALIRLTAAPIAIMGVFFPILAKSQKNMGGEPLRLIRFGANPFMLFWFILFACLIYFSENILFLWVGAATAKQVLGVWCTLSVGIFMNGLAHLPANILQSAGRSDITAKLHLFELPIYVLLLFFLTKYFGIDGVAYAWVCRVLLDTSLLFLMVFKIFPQLKVTLLKFYSNLVMGALILAGIALQVIR